MPTYVYKCPTCNASKVETRSAEHRDEPAWCDNHGLPVLMPRFLRAEALSQQINANPLYLRDEWRDHKSATEQMEERRRWDKQYEENWTPLDAKEEFAELKETLEKQGLGYEPQPGETVLA